MHLSVKWQSFCVDPNRLLVSSDWVSDKIDAMFQTELWKKIQKLFIKGNQFENISKMTATLSRPESVETSRLSIWMGALPKLFYLGAVWIQFGAIWINLKTLSVKWRSHCLGLNVLTYCGQFLVVSIWQSTLPNQFPHLGAMWIKYSFHTIVWRMAAIFLGLNVLTNCCWSKIASILQTTP